MLQEWIAVVARISSQSESGMMVVAFYRDGMVGREGP